MLFAIVLCVGKCVSPVRDSVGNLTWWLGEVGLEGDRVHSLGMRKCCESFTLDDDQSVEFFWKLWFVNCAPFYSC